jgi:hypothetical protein
VCLKNEFSGAFFKKEKGTQRKILLFKSLDVNILKISFSNDGHRSTTWQSSDKKIFKTRTFFFFKKHLAL